MTQRKAITIRFKKPRSLWILDTDDTKERVGFLEGEMRSGVPTAFVLRGKEMFELLLSDGKRVLDIPYDSVEIL